MPEDNKTSGRKRQPSWLTGEESDAPASSGGRATAEATAEVPTEAPTGDKAGGGRRRAPLSDDTDEMPTARKVLSEEHSGNGPEGGMDRVTAIVDRIAAPPGEDRARPEQRTEGNSPAEILQRLRANPAPAMLALLILAVLTVLIWFMFLRGGEEAKTPEAGNSDGRQVAPMAAKPSSSVGGVDDTGVIFGSLDENGDKASLQGAGLQWDGSVSKKEDGAGETITLEGPTAAQIERGFKVKDSEVESGVYALAQDDGSVLHVDTHTYKLAPENATGMPVEDQMTLGTIFDLEDGSLHQAGFYVDRYESGSQTVLRKYFPGPDFSEQDSYEVSFNAPKGTPVPLLVGYRANGQENQQTKQGEE